MKKTIVTLSILLVLALTLFLLQIESGVPPVVRPGLTPASDRPYPSCVLRRMDYGVVEWRCYDEPHFVTNFVPYPPIND